MLARFLDMKVTLEARKCKYTVGLVAIADKPIQKLAVVHKSIEWARGPAVAYNL
jgi:hypothetical protein